MFQDRFKQFTHILFFNIFLFAGNTLKLELGILQPCGEPAFLIMKPYYEVNRYRIL
jgi:hypothetical protein